MIIDDTARGRLVQTFRFLKELNELRNPVARDLSAYSEVLRLDAWPVHPCIVVRRGDRQEENDEESVEPGVEPLIRIQRAILTPCPKPPDVLEGWLKPSWQAMEAEASVLESRNFPDKDKGSITVEFGADQARVAALQEWTGVRANWVTAERPAVASRQLFEKIHSLWTTIQREGGRVELVLADGMLRLADPWIQHPVLMQRIGLEFDPTIPEFKFNTGTEKVELHRGLLRLVPTIEGRMIAHFDRELEVQPVEPLGGNSTDGFFRRLVQGLFNNGEFRAEKVMGAAAGLPTVWREPLIILRPRTAGLSTTLDYILEDLEIADTEVPEGLLRIVGVETGEAEPVRGGVDEVTPSTPTGPEPDILFSKPANAEQYEIAARLAKTKAVLVQGPPGTGKTHTIANLLGHLLAQGKTVLVTAHTTKALGVLRRQVDEALQPLCLSVLEGDTESQAQLYRSAQHIADRLSRSDAESLRREAGLLRGKRRAMLALADSLRRQLRDARFSEVEEVVLGGEGLSPIEVAKRIKENEGRDGWIPGPLLPGTLCPLTEVEVRHLYASQGLFVSSEEAQLAMSQPALAKLVKPAEFRVLAAEQAGADLRSRTHRPELWTKNSGSGYSAAQLEQHYHQVQQSAAMLSEKEHWLREALFAGWTGGELREAWQDLLDTLGTLVKEAGTAHRISMARGPELPPEQSVADLAAMLDEIVAFLEAGGTFGLKTKLTKRGWHQLTAASNVEGRPPRTLEDFRALRAIAKLEGNRKRFASRWRRAVESLGGPTVESLGMQPERIAETYAAEIRTRLEWRATVWDPLIRELRSAGFRWDAWLAAHPVVFGEHGELTRVQSATSQALAEIVMAQAARLRQVELSAALQAQRTYLSGYPQSDAASVLLHAQEAWNTEDYEEACRELAHLESLREAYNRPLDLLSKLEPVAPEWVRAIAGRHPPHDSPRPPDDATTAWRWRQWYQELDRRAAVSMIELQERLDRVEDDLREVAARIVEHQTWAAQRERTGLQTQQALMGFVQTLRKIGKGTGKRAPELLRQARLLLSAARGAVPVWIMPLNRVYESFDPRKTKFDVVIVDEASQSDVTALAALYLGREHVVVGDKEQVTPDAVGQRVEDVQRLIATDLQGIPNSHLYDGQTSIYNLAETAFGGVVALREHFRCVPEIIQFSNHLSYGGTIRPLREPLNASVRPALIAQRVHGFRGAGGKTNEVEAEEVASLVVACLSDPEYAVNEAGYPTSFGVISLLGDDQPLLIENLLRRRLAPDVIAKHRLLCGNAAQFQGDERDVIFLSMVDGPPEDGVLSRRDAGPQDVYKKRYNVAVSRARNQLWVVHSLDPDAHLQVGDLRRRLIEHARDPQALVRAMEEQGQRTDSIFEKLVLHRLLALGYRVQPQWSVGSYRIDLVVEGQNRRLAVECDGERWHTPEQLQRDLERQAVLERLGWVFVRIRGSLFFRDPDKAMAPVLNKLNQLGIEQCENSTLQVKKSSLETIERIRRVAEALRGQWAEEKRSDAE
jgi:very-short-patch-repair endonuclease